MQFDLAIRRGTVIDGTGAPPFPASLGIAGGRIAAICRDGDGRHLDAPESIDAHGLVVAPGFIDIHSHSDWILPQEDHPAVLAPLLEQGVTTIVTGNCGFSPAPVLPASRRLLEQGSEMVRDAAPAFEWETHGEFLDHLARRPLALNVAHLAGHGSIRLAVMRDRWEAATPPDVAGMSAWVREALEAGCFGVSTGLGYAPGMFARPEELTAVARIVAEHGALLTSHLRAYSWVSPFFPVNPLRWRAHNLRAIDEILAVAHDARARVQISHLIFVGKGTWKTQRAAIAAIERAHTDGLDVGFDTFPYTGGNTTIRVVYPGWAQHGLPANLAHPAVRRRLRFELGIARRLLRLDVCDIQLLWAATPALTDLEGLRFDAIGREMRCDPVEAYFRVTAESGARARVMLFQYSGDADDEDALRHTMAHPLNSLETDTILTTRGHHNPASFGTFPRFLGHYSRDARLLPLAAAVHKMTGLPAARLGLGDRGTVREGGWADLTLFDPATIAGPADFDAPTERPRGIRHVLLNGVPIVREGRHDGACRGQLLRRPG